MGGAKTEDKIMATFHFATYDRFYGRQFFVSKKEALDFFNRAPCDESGRELRQGNYHLDREFYSSSGREFILVDNCTNN